MQRPTRLSFSEIIMPAVRLTVRAKLLASALVLIVLCAGIAALSIARLGEVKRHAAELYLEAYTPTVAAVTAEALANDLAFQGATWEPIVGAPRGDTPAAGRDPRIKAVTAAIARDQKALAGLVPQLRQAPESMRGRSARIIAE